MWIPWKQTLPKYLHFESVAHTITNIELGKNYDRKYTKLLTLFWSLKCAKLRFVTDRKRR